MRLDVNGVSKSFGTDLVVLRGASFSVGAGQICGIVGENGAGKSTLAGLLSGVVLPDEGSVVVNIGGVSHLVCEEPGLVASIPQSPAVVDSFDAASNVFLGAEPRDWLNLIDRQRERELLRVWSGVLFSLPLGKAKDWSERADFHKLAILRAVLLERPVLVVDEAAAALDAEDRSRFLRFLRRYADEGRIVILISHSFVEVTEHCDSAFALRDGRAWEVKPPLSTDAISRHVFGEVLPAGFEFIPAPVGPVILSLDGLAPAQDCTLSAPVGVRQGEICCLVGLGKNGQDELFRGLIGAADEENFTIWHNGTDITAFTTQERRHRGMRFIPPSREEGLVIEMSCRENLLLSLGAGVWWKSPLPAGSQTAWTGEALARFEVHKRPSEIVKRLSGGNQQKVLVCKELSSRNGAGSLCVVAYNPTAGIDTGAKRVIFRSLRDIAKQGGAVFLITTDPDEALAIGDRFLVLAGGKIVGELAHPTSWESLSAMMH